MIPFPSCWQLPSDCLSLVMWLLISAGSRVVFLCCLASPTQHSLKIHLCGSRCQKSFPVYVLGGVGVVEGVSMKARGQLWCCSWRVSPISPWHQPFFKDRVSHCPVALQVSEAAWWDSSGIHSSLPFQNCDYKYVPQHPDFNMGSRTWTQVLMPAE